MNLKTIVLLAMALSVATVVTAQTKVSGTSRCAPLAPQQMLPIGDQPGHALTVAQSKCTWSEPIEIEGVKAKEGTSTSSDEVTGNSFTSRGYYVDTMANGDAAHYRFEATFSLKEGKPESGKNTWTLIGGTGKLKGLKGQGTCTGKADPDGSIVWKCAGEYKRSTS